MRSRMNDSRYLMCQVFRSNVVYPCPKILVLAFLIAFSSRTNVNAQDNRHSAQDLREVSEKLQYARKCVWLRDGRICFAVQGDYEEVTLSLDGFVGLPLPGFSKDANSIPLSRFLDSQLWFASTQINNVESGILRCRFTAIRSGSAEETINTRLRGPKAPPSVVTNNPLQGSLETFEVESAVLDAPRKVTVYLPPSYASSKELSSSVPVIYVADGQGIASFAHAMEYEILAGRMRPTAIVASHAGKYEGAILPDGSGYDPEMDSRMTEYLKQFDSPKFAKHEKFFCEELPEWARLRFKLESTREDTAVFGYSNGGMFAAQMALDHSDRFGHAIALSVAGGDIGDAITKFSTRAKFYFAGGTYEPPFLRNTSNLQTQLVAKGFQCELNARNSGHDDAMWTEEFVRYAAKIFFYQERASKDVPKANITLNSSGNTISNEVRLDAFYELQATKPGNAFWVAWRIESGDRKIGWAYRKGAPPRIDWGTVKNCEMYEAIWPAPDKIDVHGNEIIYRYTKPFDILTNCRVEKGTVEGDVVRATGVLTLPMIDRESITRSLSVEVPILAESTRIEPVEVDDRIRQFRTALSSRPRTESETQTWLAAISERNGVWVTVFPTRSIHSSTFAYQVREEYRLFPALTHLPL